MINITLLILATMALAGFITLDIKQFMKEGLTERTLFALTTDVLCIAIYALAFL